MRLETIFGPAHVSGWPYPLSLDVTFQRRFLSHGPTRELAIYVSYAYNQSMTATFDPKKEAENLKKHGVSLSEGDGVLSDPLALTIEDESAEGEQRFVTLGANTFGTLMVVVWTPRDEDVRIISVRKPTPGERRNYEKGV
jgi:uncharacterized DUF497 family protein